MIYIGDLLIEGGAGTGSKKSGRGTTLSSLLRLGPLRSLQLAHLDSDSLPHSAGEC